MGSLSVAFCSPLCPFVAIAGKHPIATNPVSAIIHFFLRPVYLRHGGHAPVNKHVFRVLKKCRLDLILRNSRRNEPSWFLTNRITINTSNDINPKKFEGSTLLTYGRETNCSSFRPETFFSKLMLTCKPPHCD